MHPLDDGRRLIMRLCAPSFREFLVRRSSDQQVFSSLAGTQVHLSCVALCEFFSCVHSTTDIREFAQAKDYANLI